jgi:hypothetical protein
MRKSFVGLLSLILVVLLLSGCPKDPYVTAIKASADVSAAVSAALPVVASYYTAGKINDAQKARVAAFLGNVTDANMKFRQGAVSLHNAGATGTAAYVALAQDFVNSLPTDPTAFFYYSKDSQDQFNAVLLAVKTAINGVLLLVESAKGAK